MRKQVFFVITLPATVLGLYVSIVLCVIGNLMGRFVKMILGQNQNDTDREMFDGKGIGENDL